MAVRYHGEAHALMQDERVTGSLNRLLHEVNDMAQMTAGRADVDVNNLRFMIQVVDTDGEVLVEVTDPDWVERDD